VSTHENERALDQDQQVAKPEAEAVTEDPTRQLAPELRARIASLQPGAPQQLALLCHQYPMFVDAILTQAAQQVGNHTVAEAVKLLSEHPAGETYANRRANDLSFDGFRYDDSLLTLEGKQGDLVREHLDFIHAHPHLRSKVVDGFGRHHPELFDELVDRLIGEDQSKGAGDAEKKATEREAESAPPEAAAPKEETKAATNEVAKDSPWVVSAKRFNAAHDEHTNEFNRLTDNVCVGPDGVVDPKLVSDWQAAHGLQPDGRVGPATVEAAQNAVKAVAGPHAVPMPTGGDGVL
jgi:hypothetical protein